jgi:ABC-type multidrug transport system ATPase subunit
MASRRDAVVDGRGLTRRYPNGLGITDVDFSARAGTLVAITGINGSGKTTLLRLLATLNAPSRGELSWWGCFDRRSPRVRRRLGVMLDTAVHFDELTGEQNALFFAARYGLVGSTAREQVHSLLEWAALAEVPNLPVREYSLGMRRRLSLVETLSHRPELIVLDEPSLALDYKGELGLESRLMSEAERGAAVVVATNDPRLEAICETVIHLERGRVVASASAA